MKLMLLGHHETAAYTGEEELVLSTPTPAIIKMSHCLISISENTSVFH